LEETGSLCLLKYKSPRRATNVKPVRSILDSFSEGLGELQKAAAADPDSPCCEENYARLHANTTGAAELLNEASKGLEPEDLRAIRQSSYAIVKSYLDGSEACRRCLTKPLGYPGDYLLMEQILTGQNRGRGLAYHFDRFFLSQPGCEAIRRRSRWATGQLDSILKQAEKRPVRVLDLGCGPMAIENELQKSIPPGQVVELIGVDNDPDALRFAASRLNHTNTRVSTSQVNLLSKAGIAEIGTLVQKSDVVVSMGLIEYFSDETVLLLLSAASRAMRSGCRLLLGNYQPAHASRALMEWFLDWWLVYRTEAQLQTLLVRAGFEQHKIHTELDATGSIILAQAFR
jgi:extracellular factor (EF) 3-hydroxypalmitic acid methyl ester biosynthesis protein